MHAAADTVEGTGSTRRGLLGKCASAAVAAAAAATMNPTSALAASDKVVVLGGTGFVGSAVVKELEHHQKACPSAQEMLRIMQGPIVTSKEDNWL